MDSKILVPVDTANAGKLTKAFDVAARTAKATRATVVYVGVVDAVPTTSVRTEGDRQKTILGDLAAEQARSHGIETTIHVAPRGDLHLHVGSEIIKAADETGCDLIVMASHVPGIRDHFLSSNAGYVATHAPVSVYVVR